MRRNPTLKDLEATKAELDHLIERDGLDTSGNLDKYHSRISAKREEIHALTIRLKASGVIPYSDEERLWLQLDRLHPNAANGVTVNHEGKRYVKVLTPRSKSRSGRTVYTWNARWVCKGEVVDVDPDQAAAQKALEDTLDALFPNARSRDIVEHSGQRYQKRFAPDTMSSSGRTVRKWKTWWEPL